MAYSVLDLNTNVKLRLILLFNHLLGAYALVTAFSWNWLVTAYIIGFLFGGLGISVCYHRFYAHKSFATYKPVEYLLLAIATLSSVGSAITWVGIHREHHATSDTDKDPHSPKYNGTLKTLVHIWKHYNIKPMFVRDLIKNQSLKFQHEHYFSLLLGFILASLIILGPVVTAYIYAIPAVYVFYATGIVNSINHWGGKPRNIPVLNIITSGESYHANHHKKANSYKLGKYDPMLPFIKLIKI
jgi:stearoyl-CoA desaturase (delta-9 desaturase)